MNSDLDSLNIVRKGGNVDDYNDFGDAAERGYTKTTERLIKKGGYYNWDHALITGTTGGHIGVLKLLIENHNYPTKDLLWAHSKAQSDKYSGHFKGTITKIDETILYLQGIIQERYVKEGQYTFDPQYIGFPKI